MLLKRLALFIGIVMWMLGTPLLAQTGTHASTSSRSAGSSSIFSSKEGNAVKKRNKVKRSKKGYNNKAGLFSKKKKSDCDCPGSPKAQRKKRRR